MRPEIRHRVNAVERLLAASAHKPVSDTELLEALSNRSMTERHLNALYARIEDPLTTVMVTAAAQWRKLRADGHVVDQLWPTLKEISDGLSYVCDADMPPALQAADPFRKPHVLPQPEENLILWELSVRGWLGWMVVTRQGKDRLRQQVAEYVKTQQILAPVLDAAEAEYLLDFVDPLESRFHRMDLPLLMWVDEDGNWCKSHKPSIGYPPHRELDKAGQRWTPMGP